MTASSESGQSSAESPPAGFAFSGKPVFSDGPETVVNPERRGMADGQPRGAGSGIWNQLFPTDSQLQEGGPGINPAGVKLSHFAIQSRIGSGGMGAVFRATDERLDRTVALKILSPAQSYEPAAVQRFQNEARAAARMSHSNIAGVYYVGEDQGLHFIAHEFIDGTNIRQLILEHGRLEPAEAVNYTLQIARALVHTSAAGLVHRDIKPSNIIVTATGQAKLVDLGLARKQVTGQADDLTMAGTTLGTFDYISPEQAKDPRNVDVRSDIYSLGCTLYHMLTGAAPYPEGTVLQKLLDHQGSDPPDPAKKNPHVSPELSAIVKRMMASDPARRYRTPEELIRELMPLAAALGLRGVHPDGLVWTSPRLQRRRFWERNVGWIAPVAVLLVIVLVLDRFPDLGNEAAQRASSAQEWTNENVSKSAATETAAVSPLPAEEAADVPDPPAPSGRANEEIADSSSAADDEQNTVAPRRNQSEGAMDDDIPLDVIPTDEPFSQSEILATIFGSRDPDLKPLVSPDEPFADDLEEVKPVDAPRPEPRLARRDQSPVEAPQPEIVARKPVGDVEVEPNTDSVIEESPSDVRPQAAPISIAGFDTEYLTLEAAISAAQDGQIIELRYDGRRPGPPEKALRVKNKRITIRAGRNREGELYRPTIVFDAGYSPVEGDTRMMTLMGGSVDLINVDLEVNVHFGTITDQWALFLLQGNERVELKGVNITVNNPGRAPATVFELRSGPESGMSNMDQLNLLPANAGNSDQEFRIKIIDSFVRGNCDLFLVKRSSPGRFEVANSVFGVDGSLLGIQGDIDMAGERADFELQLEHVTALVGNSVIRMDSGQESRVLLPVRVNAQNNIFATNTASPLVAMTGTTGFGEFRTRLSWNGTKNFYDGFESFWSIAPTIPTADLEQLDFEEWKDRWGSDMEFESTADGIEWQNSWRSTTELSTLDLSDIAFDDEAKSESSIWDATDVGTVGADTSKLADEPSSNGN